MRISLHIEGDHDEAEVQAILSVLAGGMAFRPGEPVKGNVQSMVEETPKRRGRPAKAEAEAEPEVVNEKEQAEPEAEEDAKPAAPVVDAGTGQPVEPAADRAAVKTRAMLIVAQPGGKATLEGLFKKHGVGKLSELPDDKLPEFAQDVEAVLAV